jgi:WhiB family redox-sensing transcriptional regulator
MTVNEGVNMSRSSGSTRVSERPESPITARLPGPSLVRWGWQQRAACRGMDEAWFFPPDRERAKARSARVARAKAICATCPVMAACRAHALEVGEPFGVWGGLCEEERGQ